MVAPQGITGAEISADDICRCKSAWFHWEVLEVEGSTSSEGIIYTQGCKRVGLSF